MGAQGQALFTTLLDAVKAGLVAGIHSVFVLSLVIMVVGLLAVFFLQEIELRGRGRQRSGAEAPAQSEAPLAFH